jgi:hypothetical protein
MPSRWIERTRYWSRRRFALMTVMVTLVCVALLILDGISAAVHFHAGVAVFGVAFFVVLILWFRVMEARSPRIKRD